jgi:hypothetical protein
VYYVAHALALRMWSRQLCIIVVQLHREPEPRD